MSAYREAFLHGEVAVPSCRVRVQAGERARSGHARLASQRSQVSNTAG